MLVYSEGFLYVDMKIIFNSFPHYNKSRVQNECLVEEYLKK